MKICILGYGYIGSALTELYEKSDHELTVIDSEIPFHRLLGQPFKFIQSKIQDCDKWNLEQYDIVYNLIGIASTKDVDHELIDDINRKYAIEVAKKSKRYIFASSCNVFGGLKKESYRIDEKKIPCPTNAYALSKYRTEHWLKKNHKNYVICRFGNNFGFSYGMRYRPVGNVFMLNCMFNRKIKINSLESRPFCHVKDTARALFYLAHKEKIKNEIFHVVKNNYRLIDLARMLKNNYNKELEVSEKLIGNNTGYHISNKKILGTGFKFKFDFHYAYQELRKLFKNVKVIK